MYFKILLKSVTFLSLFINFSCKENIKNEENSDLTKLTTIKVDTLEKYRKLMNIQWSKDSMPIKIQNRITHKKKFSFDSVIGVDYVGYYLERVYFPINKSGKKISSIIKEKKLNNNQVAILHNILGSNETYKNPIIVACYQPRLGFIYYKDGCVIAQTQICLGCAQLRSTIKLGNKEYGGLFNKKATDDLAKLRFDLGFNSKLPGD